MALRAGMSIAEAIQQLTRGFQKVMGRKPDGLEKIKIQQEAVKRLKELEKVVDMQGNVIDTSKGIMGGRQIQESKEFGKKVRETYDAAKGPGKGQEMVDALKSPGAKKSYKIMEDQLGVKLYGDETFDEILEIQRTGKHPRGEPAPGIDSESLKKRLMEGKNPFSDLVKTTEKGPKSLQQRRLEAAIDNVSPGFTGDTKYDAELVAGDLAEKMGKVYDDLPTKERLDIYDQAYTGLSKQRFKNKPEPEDMAQGGRAGFANGSAGAPSIVLNPDEREAGKVFETDKVEEAIKEIIRRGIGPLNMAEIPLTEKGRLRFGFDSSGDRQISGGLDLLGGELDFGAGSGRQGKGIGFEFRKKFGGPKGERVKRKEGGGMSRRQFIKIMGGIASLPFIGKFFKGAKPAAKVAEVATKSMPAQPPEYFFDLAAKIKILGKESKVARQERMIEVNYKNYTLEEDLVTGDMTIVKRKGDPEFGYEEEVMALRKGQADEMTKGTKPADEYEELTVRPDPEGKMKDVEDGIEPESIQEIVEEVGQGGGNLDQRTLEEIARGRLASGGVAMMLGE
jgi:hypothetical protein